MTEIFLSSGLHLGVSLSIRLTPADPHYQLHQTTSVFIPLLYRLHLTALRGLQIYRLRLPTQGHICYLRRPLIQLTD